MIFIYILQLFKKLPNIDIFLKPWKAIQNFKVLVDICWLQNIPNTRLQPLLLASSEKGFLYHLFSLTILSYYFYYVNAVGFHRNTRKHCNRKKKDCTNLYHFPHHQLWICFILRFPVSCLLLLVSPKQGWKLVSSPTRFILNFYRPRHCFIFNSFSYSRKYWRSFRDETRILSWKRSCCTNCKGIYSALSESCTVWHT